MRSIKTTSGPRSCSTATCSPCSKRCITRSRPSNELERSFEDLTREINHLIDQLTDDERRAYLAESLFLNQVKYENDKLEAYLRKLEKKSAAERH